MTLAIPSNTKHIPRDITIGGSFKKMKIKEFKNPRIMPNSIVRRRKKTMF